MILQRLYMETTAITAQRTAADISTLLVRGGARQIAMDYDDHHAITGLRFTLPVRGADLPYALPVKTEPIFQIINGRRKREWDRAEKAAEDRQQAERVAWRQLFRWVEAQLALVEVGMVEAPEVFMPYMEVSPGKTFYIRAIETGLFTQKQLKSRGDE